MFYPLSGAAEERVDQRSAVGVSQGERHRRPYPVRGLTHPVIATLDHPLSAFGGKRVVATFFYISNTQGFKPIALFAFAGKRVAALFFIFRTLKVLNPSLSSPSAERG